MLRGLRTAVQYFTLGLALGLLLAPRKGDETRAALWEQVQATLGDAFAGAQGASRMGDHHPDDSTRPYSARQSYDDTAAGPQ